MFLSDIDEKGKVNKYLEFLNVQKIKIETHRKSITWRSSDEKGLLVVAVWFSLF